MQTLKFKTEINATANKIWGVLWDDKTYRKWTTAFCEGSYAESNWNEGNKIHFLGPNGDGIYSKIHQKIENKLISFQHIGNIKNYQEMPIDDETKEWCNSFETYELLSEGNEKIILIVSVDALEQYVSFFNETMPKALELIKNISEE